MQSQKSCRLQEKEIVCSCSSSKPISQNGLWRRDLVLFGISSSVSLVFPSTGKLIFGLLASYLFGLLIFFFA